MQWLILVNGKEKALFEDEVDALQYRDFLKNLNRMAGYKDKYEIKKYKKRNKRRNTFTQILCVKVFLPFSFLYVINAALTSALKASPVIKEIILLSSSFEFTIKNFECSSLFCFM